MKTILTLATIWLIGAGNADLSVSVDKLLGRLNSRSLAEREEATEKLIELGPDTLPLLPTGRTGLPAETAVRLDRVRRKLSQIWAAAPMRGSRVSVSQKDISLKECLAIIAKQSGNRIVLPEPENLRKMKISVDFDKSLFWDALATILDKAHLTVDPQGPPGMVTIVRHTVVERPFGQSGQAVGPFWIAVEKIMTNTTALQLELRAIWEPRIEPIQVRLPLDSLEAIDSTGRSLVNRALQKGQLIANPDSRLASSLLNIRLMQPTKSVERIASFSGRLEFLIPGRKKTFRFDRLLETDSQTERFADVELTRGQVRRDDDKWAVWVELLFDQPDRALESYFGWIFQNRAWLTTADGKEIAPTSFDSTRRTESEAGIVYRFDLKNPPSQMTFNYRSPTAIIQSEAGFQLRNLTLPE
jgi:hypothetical protein